MQNFAAPAQEKIVQQLVAGNVHSVRTSMRLDEKNLALIKNLHQHGMSLVLNTGVEYAVGTIARPADAKSGMRSAMPLSEADPERSRVALQAAFDKLDANGITLAGLSWATS